MTGNQQAIIDMLSLEISASLTFCEHSRNESSGDVDKIDAHILSYGEKVKVLRVIREDLEDEFTIMHYDPR